MPSEPTKTLTISGIDGQIRCTVDLEFIPMAIPMGDESHTAALKQMVINDINIRLAAVARSLAHALERETIEDLERRMKL